MYYLYVDGSGSSKISHKSEDGRFYILSGVIIHESDLEKIEKSVLAAKKKLFPGKDPESWELHAYDIWNSLGMFSEEKLAVNFYKKRQIFSDMIDIICGSKITLVVVIVFKDHVKDSHITPKILELSWNALIDRFEWFLKQNQKNTNHGLIFSDESEKISESRIKNEVFSLVTKGSADQQINHVIKYPIFVGSYLENMIQLADLIAYVVYKHHRGNPTFRHWFEMLKSKVYGHDRNMYHLGLKKFP